MVRIGLMSIGVLGVALSAAPRVTQYRAVIRGEDGHSYRVEISVSLGAEGWPKPSYTLDGRAFERVALHDGVPANGTYRLNYTVAGAARRVRIPLPVPEIGTAGAPRSVVIETDLPPGYEISGDMFPVFQRKDSGGYVAELANVPNHVEFDAAREGESKLLDHWLTPTMMSDCGVVALLVIASVTRFLLRKKVRDAA